MSSSNLVRVLAIPETTYGVTPTGNMTTVRFTSEKLSGTPDTVESAQIRTDRLSSGQVVTGLKVGGDISYEFAREPALDLFMASAMNNSWVSFAAQTVNLTLDTSVPGNYTLTRDTGSWIADGYVPGMYATLGGFASAANNTQVMIAQVVSATVVRVVGPAGINSGAGTTTTIKRGDQLTVGTQKQSFTMEKTFLDLTTKGILYSGMIAGQMDLKIDFGSLISGSFSFSGNGYKSLSQASDFVSAGRVITPAATTNTFNGSIDMPFVATAAVGNLDSSGLAIQSVSLTLNNNLSAQNVIGNIAPVDYSAGTAKVEVSLNAYLKDAAWGLLAKKLSQASFAMSFMVRNGGGWYAFYLPAVQVSFDDPTSGGQNQDISLEMKGTGKVGDDGSSSVVIYRSPM